MPNMPLAPRNACCRCPTAWPGRRGRAARSHFTVWTNLMDTRPAQARRKRADPWRLQRHRHRRDPASGRARPDGVHHRRQRGEMRRLRKAGRQRAINYRERGFRRRGQGRNRRPRRRRHPRHGRRRLYPAQHSAAALWGRIVNIAYQKGTTAKVNFAPMLMKRLSLLATTLRGRSQRRKGRHPRRPAQRSGR